MSRGKPYQVEWTSAALEDLSGVVLHIAESRPATAETVAVRIEVRASTLALFPDRGHLVPELAAQGVQEYREIIEPPWRLVYRIADRRVFVLGVLDSRRSLEDLLLERLVRWKPPVPEE